jgi:hypothetical protein
MIIEEAKHENTNTEQDEAVITVSNGTCSQEENLPTEAGLEHLLNYNPPRHDDLMNNAHIN